MVSLNVLEQRPLTLQVFAVGNTKLGRGGKVLSFSLPAVTTCPGRSDLCEEQCYAMDPQTWFSMPSVGQRYRLNLTFTKRKKFCEIVSRTLKRSGRPFVRLHVSGDFYSAKYTRKWVKIVRENPEKTFWAYTRSWAVPTILPALYDLADLPNFFMWFSIDFGMDRVKLEHPRIRWAHMMVIEEERPKKVDLIFRINNLRDTVVKRVGGTLVCPPENGVSHAVTCDKCRLCFSDPVAEPNKRTRR